MVACMVCYCQVKGASRPPSRATAVHRQVDRPCIQPASAGSEATLLSQRCLVVIGHSSLLRPKPPQRSAFCDVAGGLVEGDVFLPPPATSARSSYNRDDNKIWSDDRRSSMPNPQLPPLLSPEPDREGSPTAPTSNKRRFAAAGERQLRGRTEEHREGGGDAAAEPEARQQHECAQIGLSCETLYSHKPSSICWQLHSTLTSSSDNLPLVNAALALQKTQLAQCLPLQKAHMVTFAAAMTCIATLDAQSSRMLCFITAS